MSEPLPVTGELILPAELLTWEASRSPGPGGQNVNKTATKITLRFDLPACEVLAPDVVGRLRHLARGRLDREGKIVVVSTRYRSQPRNLEDARERLRELVEQALVKPKPRKKTRPSKGAKRRRLDAKRQQSERKQGRRPVRRGDD